MAQSLTVPLLDLKLQYAPMRDEIEREIRVVCDSQYFVLGPKIAEFEGAIAEYCGVTAGVGVSSGTDALLLALMVLGIGPGDEVITSPYTFFATGGVIARLGARPIFCDIEFPSFNLSPAAVARFIDEQCEQRDEGLVNRHTGGVVKALMPVHLYGQMADMGKFGALARQHALAVVEDAAQAIGAELANGQRAGSVSDIGCLSFFPTKNLGAFGDAGMCVTSDPDIAAKLKLLRVHGGERKYYHSEVGGNFRIDEIQAAVLLVKLRYLDGWTAGRQSNADFYTAALEAAGLREFVTPPTVDTGKRHIFNQYVIRTPRRDALRDYLHAQGVGCEIYYPLSLHEQDCFKYLGYGAADLPNASQAAKESLALPIFPELTTDQQETVVRSIAEFFGR